MTEISNTAFQNCAALEKIVVSAENQVYHSNGNCLIETESNTLVLGCKNSVIPSDGSVTSIGKNAFYGCSDLENLTMPVGNITSIGENAFYGCGSLTSVTIPDGVSSIGTHAFYNCQSITDIVIPDSVTEIGNSVFDGVLNPLSLRPNIERATLPAHAISAVFFGSSLETVVITSGTSIGSNAFYNCSGLTSIVLPDSITEIGSSAFYSCSSLTSFTIPDGITSIANWAFANCSNLQSVNIPESVISIGEYAFYCCDKLTDIYYDGTAAQWEPIDKKQNWDCSTSGRDASQRSYTVHCKNGEEIKVNLD